MRRIIFLLPLLLAACYSPDPVSPASGPKDWVVTYPLPARLVCIMDGGADRCVWMPPDRCHVDHPTYRSDVAKGICAWSEDV